MAKYIVKATIQTLEKGKKLVLKPGAEPQEVPKGLVKELLGKGLIEEVAGTTGKTSATDADAGTGGTGDENSGD